MSETMDGLNFASRLLQIKKKMQNLEEIKLAQAQAQQHEAQQELMSIQDEQHRIKEAVHEVVSAPERYLHFHQLDVLSVRESLQQSTVEVAKAGVSAQQKKVHHAYQESEQWKMLVSQYQEESHKESQSIEQKMLDESAGVRFQMAQSGGY